MGDGTTINKITALNRFGVFVVPFCRPSAESGPSRRSKLNRANKNRPLRRLGRAFIRRPAAGPTFGGSEVRRLRKEKGEREREKTWVFPARTIDELKSLERGRAGADTRCQFGTMPCRCRFKSLTRRCRCRFKTMPCQYRVGPTKSVLDIKIKSS